MRSARCRDFAETRQFFLDYIEKVVRFKDKLSLHGWVPIRQRFGDDSETTKLPFRIENEITREERYAERMRTERETQYQQSIADLRTASADTRRKSA